MPTGFVSPELPNITFFGDASSKDSAYMVAGGFAIAGHRINEVQNAVRQIREEGKISKELKWSKYRGGPRRQAYEKLIDYSFDLLKKRHAALHIIVAKFEGYNHKERKGENRDTSINRMYYQLLLHRVARYYGGSRAIHVRLDEGNDSEDICEMRNPVCADAYRTYKTKPNCIRTIEPVSSEKFGAVQMADVIIGAVAAKCNQVTHASSKGDLANYVLNKSGLASWSESTHRNARFLTVWHHQTKEVPRNPIRGG